jgi:histidinol dehydrogenase
LAIATQKEVERQMQDLSRKEIIKQSLNKYSGAVVLKNWEEAIQFTNEYSPEHLEVLVKDPFAVLPKLKNAGSIFLGEYAPVAIGDYASGTNHILPTGFWSKMVSAVGVETFQKTSEIQYLTKEGLENLEEIVDVVSGIEKLDGHWNSINVRINKKKRFMELL